MSATRLSDLPPDLPSDLPADLKIIRHPRATRMKLRLDRRDGAPVLVLPPQASVARGHDFVRDHLGWIATHQARRPLRQTFADGVTFPFGDHSLTISHQVGDRVAVRRTGDKLLVGGAAEHVNRRVTDWLKQQARQRLGDAARRHAETLDVRIARIRIADQKSRWGSCSSARVLSFNWRLVLAPGHVLDFVAAHEVAHMREMNHGPAFHRLEAELHPNPKAADAWLKHHGPGLRRWG